LGSAPADPNVILGPAHVRIQSNFRSASVESRVILGHAPGKTQHLIGYCTSRNQSYFGSCRTNFKSLGPVKQISRGKKIKIRIILK